jgi:hypothetical protein
MERGVGDEQQLLGSYHDNQQDRMETSSASLWSFWVYRPVFGRLLMPGTSEIGQHWTGRAAATELAMSRCDADCITTIKRDGLESRPTSLWSFWI